MVCFNKKEVRLDKDTSQRILIIEDHPLVGGFLKDCLELEGYKVVGPISEESAAIEYLHDHVVSAALLDFYLNHSTTLSIVEKIQENNIPFAFMSGEDLGGLLPASLHNVPQLRKPFSSSELSSCLQGLLYRDTEYALGHKQ